MKISIIGSGNVAHQFAIKLHKSGQKIVQVYSQNIDNAISLATIVEAQPISNIQDLEYDSDYYILAIKDDFLGELIRKIDIDRGVWIHTAGSVDISIFKENSNKKDAKFGVLYPLQTLSKHKEINWNKVPIFIEASEENALKKIEILAKKLSPKIKILSSEKRKYVHLAAVFACNFTNYFYSASSEILQKANLDFECLLPLIDETCDKVHKLDPILAQTGPAMRGDKKIMEKQLKLLEADNQLSDVYKLLSDCIFKLYNSK